MSEQDSNCAPGEIPCVPAIDWLESSDFYLYRNGCYDVSFDEARVAYLYFLASGSNVQIDYLDLIRWGALGGIRSPEDVEKLIAIEQGGAIWCEQLPDALLEELQRSQQYHLHKSTYKFRRRQASYAISKRDVRSRIIDRDGGCCRKCGSDSDLCLDHIVPVVLGGGDSEDNLQVLCRTCNSRKGWR